METALTTLALAIITAGLIWFGRTVLKHESRLVDFHARLVVLEREDGRRRDSIADVHEKMNRVDANVIRIAAKMGVDVQMPPG